MKTIRILLILLFAFFVNQSFAQRNLLELMSSDAEPFTGATLNTRAYVAEYFAPFMHSYDGTNLITIDFPVKDGNQRYFDGGKLVNFNSAIYMLLTSNGLDGYLYRFDGAAFREITVPDWPVEILAHKDKLYIMTQPVIGHNQLYVYDGTRMDPVGTLVPNSFINYTFEVAGDYLYYGGVDYTIDGNRVLRRYDGTSLTYLPLSGHFNVLNIVGIPGTEIAYFNTGRNIRKFDGVNLTTIYTGPSGATISTFLAWRGALYFQVTFSAASGTPPILYRYNGSALSTVALPAGNDPIPLAEGIVYEDNLFIPVKLSPTTEGILKFNGISFSNFFMFPEPTSAPELFEREENLVIIPQHQESDTVYVYDDITFTTVAASPGTEIHSYLTGVNCFHLWNTFDGTGYAASKETVCSEPVSVIPRDLWDFDKIEFGIGAKYRDWCWTDIFWNWEVTPLCPVPEICPDPLFQVTLSSLNGKIGFQEKFDQPFQLDIPLADNQSYQAALSSISDKVPETLILLDNDLVAKGFSEIKMSMVPSQDYLLLEVATDKIKKLPFTMKLLDAKGKTVWEQTYTAPF